MTRLENRCDDIQHCLDDLRSSSPLAAAFQSAAATRYRHRKKRRSCGNGLEEGDEDSEDDEDNNGPRSLSAVEGLSGEAAEDVFRRTRRNRLFLAPPASWEMRKRTVRSRFAKWTTLIIGN